MSDSIRDESKDMYPMWDEIEDDPSNLNDCKNCRGAGFVLEDAHDHCDLCIHVKPCPECGGTVKMSRKQYEELKEKAGKWDLAQMATLKALYGKNIMDSMTINTPTLKEAQKEFLKAFTGALKTGAIKIEKGAEEVLGEGEEG